MERQTKTKQNKKDEEEEQKRKEEDIQDIRKYGTIHKGKDIVVVFNAFIYFISEPLKFMSVCLSVFLSVSVD